MSGTGPFVQAALFCDRLLAEQDGVLTPVRIIDRVFFALDDDSEPIVTEHRVTMLVVLKAGTARGSYPLAIERELPSGERESPPLVESSVHLEGEDRGVNVVLQNMPFSVEQGGQGLYWYDVIFDGDVITRVPLRAVYQRLPTVSGQAG